MKTSYHSDKNYKVSALDAALKLLTDIYKKIKHFLGILLIDHTMRGIVAWYDKRHTSLKVDTIKDNDGIINKLHKQIAKLNGSISELEGENSDLRTKENNLVLKNETLTNELNQLDAKKIKLEQENDNLKRCVEDLKLENLQFQKRCLPSSEIPSMIYYAQGDTSGLNFRKISTLKTSQHIYKITTLPGDSCSAFFEPDVESDSVEVINNRNITLIACDILSISPNASAISVCEKGKAAYKNKKWTVISKAKIILS